jgi:hypothetical protein
VTAAAAVVFVLALTATEKKKDYLMLWSPTPITLKHAVSVKLPVKYSPDKI